MSSKKEIKTPAELEALFQAFVETPFSELQENVAGEYVRIVSVSNWVHIAFIRHDEEIRIEVEVSLPSSTCGENLEDSSDQLILIQGMMTHILYIRNLIEMGYSLSIIKEDCLWVASTLISKNPSPEVFEALVPPTEN